MKKKKKPILDPLWITKGTFLDPEYFTYVLLGASQKYRKEIEEGNLDHFYEVMFHSLNLNNLVVEGKLFDFKLKPIFDNPRIVEIRDHLKEIYQIPQETMEIFRNANYVFSNLLLDYMDLQLDVLDELRIFHVNRSIHTENEIFIVANKEKDLNYHIWSLKSNKKSNFGYSFTKVVTIVIEEIKENALKEAIDKLALPELANMQADKNVCFGIVSLDIPREKIAIILKDTILLNKGIAKTLNFEPNIIEELHKLIFNEKVMPFTLNKWM